MKFRTKITREQEKDIRRMFEHMTGKKGYREGRMELAFRGEMAAFTLFKPVIPDFSCFDMRTKIGLYEVDFSSSALGQTYDVKTRAFGWHQDWVLQGKVIEKLATMPDSHFFILMIDDDVFVEFMGMVQANRITKSELFDLDRGSKYGEKVIRLDDLKKKGLLI